MRQKNGNWKMVQGCHNLIVNFIIQKYLIIKYKWTLSILDYYYHFFSLPFYDSYYERGRMKNEIVLASPRHIPRQWWSHFLHRSSILFFYFTSCLYHFCHRRRFPGFQNTRKRRSLVFKLCPYFSSFFSSFQFFLLISWVFSSLASYSER